MVTLIPGDGELFEPGFPYLVHSPTVVQVSAPKSVNP